MASKLFKCKLLITLLYLLLTFGYDSDLFPVDIIILHVLETISFLWNDVKMTRSFSLGHIQLKGLRPVLEGFVVPMHEGACETGSQIPRA